MNNKNCQIYQDSCIDNCLCESCGNVLANRISHLEADLKESRGEVLRRKSDLVQMTIQAEGHLAARKAAERERGNPKAMLSDLGIVADGDKPYVCPGCEERDAVLDRVHGVADWFYESSSVNSKLIDVLNNRPPRTNEGG